MRMITINLMSFIENALRLVEINSVTDNGNEEIINHLIPVFEGMGMKIITQQVPHSQENSSKRQFNIVGILGDDLVDSRFRKGLLLCTHIDTASAGVEADWKALEGKPWTPKIVDDFICGLGVAKSKLDFYCKQVATERFVKANLKEPLYLAATCGGESPIAGAKYLIQSGVVNPKHVMVGYPTGLSLFHGHRSIINYNLKLSYVAKEKDAQDFNAKIQMSVTGQTGHLGYNPVDKPGLALTKLFFLLEELRKTKIPAKLFNFESSSSFFATPGKAQAGVVISSKDMEEIREFFRDFLSKNPGQGYELKFGGTGDRGIRLLPDELLAAIFGIRDLAKEVNESLVGTGSCLSIGSIFHERDSLQFSICIHLDPEIAGPEERRGVEQDIKMRVDKLAANYKKLSFEMRRLLSTPKFNQDNQSVFINTLAADLERSGLDKKISLGMTNSDASYFAEKNYPVVAFGPGDEMNNTHTAQERVKMDSLYSAVRFYSQAIETFCVRGI